MSAHGDSSSAAASYSGWAVLELMGHRRLAGRVGEATIGGASFIRIDVPGVGDDVVATQFYAPGALYCLTPTTEKIARAVARSAQPTPVHRWELAAATADSDHETGDGGYCVACSEGEHDSCASSWNDEDGIAHPCTCPCPGAPEPF